MALGVAAKVIGRDILDRTIIYIARSDDAVSDQLAKDRDGVGIDLVVVGCHVGPRFTKLAYKAINRAVKFDLTLEAILLARAPIRAYDQSMIDAAQMRAARALLGWRMDDLSAKAGVSLASIKNIERGVTDPRASTLRAIQSAFEEAGLLFLEPGDARSGGRGVRFKAG